MGVRMRIMVSEHGSHACCSPPRQGLGPDYPRESTIRFSRLRSHGQSFGAWNYAHDGATAYGLLCHILNMDSVKAMTVRVSEAKNFKNMAEFLTLSLTDTTLDWRELKDVISSL